MVDKYLHRVVFFFPTEYVVKFIPLVLLLLQSPIKYYHFIHFPVDLKVIVITESGKKYCLISLKWRHVFNFLLFVSKNGVIAFFEKFHVACVHVRRRCPAIIAEVLVLIKTKLEKQSIVKCAVPHFLLIDLQSVGREVLWQNKRWFLFQISKYQVLPFLVFQLESAQRHCIVLHLN